MVNCKTKPIEKVKVGDKIRTTDPKTGRSTTKKVRLILKVEPMEGSMYGEFAATDWSSLRHAYGPATDAPEHISGLSSTDRQQREKAYDWMYSAIVHQGTRWEASAVVARYVVELVANPSIPDRAKIFELLAALALGDDGDFLPGGFPVEKMRADVARVRAATDEELRRELDEWVAGASTERIRQRRESLADVKKDNLDLEMRRLPVWRLQSYDAVREGVPDYCVALGDQDPEVRSWVAYLLGWFPEDAATITPRLLDLIRREAVPIVKATACIAAGSVAGRDIDSLTPELSAQLVNSERIIRWGAAIGLSVALAGIPDAVANALHDCVENSTNELSVPPYLNGDMRAMAAQLLAKYGHN